MIMPLAFLFTVLLVPVFRGEFWKLGAIKLEHRELILASLFIQVLIISVIHGQLSPEIASALHLVSYAFGIGFVWFNRNVIGMPIIVLGGLLNVLAIAVNNGVMPARIGALRTAGIAFDTGDFENSAPVDDARLWFLGDVFAIPERFPFSNVFSVGDIFLVLGGAITVHVVCGSKVVPQRWRAKVNLTDAARQAIEAEAAAATAAEAATETSAEVELTESQPVSAIAASTEATTDLAASNETASTHNATTANTGAEDTTASTSSPAEKIASVFGKRQLVDDQVATNSQPQSNTTAPAEPTLTPVPQQPATPDVAPAISMSPAPTLNAMFAQDNRPLVQRNSTLDEPLADDVTANSLETMSAG